MQLFIGLTFRQNHLLYKKIDSFRKRFDEKFTRSDILQMTLIPPFKMDGITMFELQDIIEDLSDDLDTHLSCCDIPCEVDFNGFDFQSGRKGIVFLKPSIPVDIFHCQENLSESVKGHGGVFNKHKNLAKSFSNDLQTFLPIGRSTDMELLKQAVDKAQIEFAQPFSLTAKDVVLFEKLPGQWIPRRVLFSFAETGENFQNERSDFSLIKTPANL